MGQVTYNSFYYVGYFLLPTKSKLVYEPNRAWNIRCSIFLKIWEGTRPILVLVQIKLSVFSKIVKLVRPFFLQSPRAALLHSFLGTFVKSKLGTFTVSSAGSVSLASENS
jgi:hypothetical protein